jgi:hypothetical protein
MYILELPNIPKNKKQLRALINEARHQARIRVLVRWCIYGTVAVEALVLWSKFGG